MQPPIPPDQLRRMQGQLGRNPMGFGKPNVLSWAEVEYPIAEASANWQQDATQYTVPYDFRWTDYINTTGPTNLIAKILGFAQRVPSAQLGGNVVGASWASNIARIVTEEPHGLTIGDAVDISEIVSVGPGDYNGLGQIVVNITDPRAFDVAIGTNPGAYISSGKWVGPKQRDKLHREIPWICPYIPWLYATAVTNVKGVKAFGKFPVVGNVAPRLTFDRARFNVTFTTLPYRVLTDDQLAKKFDGDESQRYVFKPLKSTSEYISIMPGFFRYKEGRPGPPNGPPGVPGGPGLGQKFPLGVAKILTKVDLEWTWYNVPENFIFNNQQYPANILNGMGCVNSAAIWGYPKGTLLALPVEFTPRNQPINPVTLGLQPEDPPRSWDIKFLFKFWDPPIGTKGSGSVTPVTRGHNTNIWVDDALFYLIKSEHGDPLFKDYDFNLFFQAVDL